MIGADGAPPLTDAAATEAAAVNREFYESEQPGVVDYWTYMAAPRARMATVLREVRRAAPAVVVDLGCGGGPDDPRACRRARRRTRGARGARTHPRNPRRGAVSPAACGRSFVIAAASASV